MVKENHAIFKTNDLSHHTHTHKSHTIIPYDAIYVYMYVCVCLVWAWGESSVFRCPTIFKPQLLTHIVPLVVWHE